MNNATQTIETNSSTGCAIFKVPGLEYVFHSLTHLTYEGNSFVTFELFPEGDKTKLKLTHKGLETFPASNPDLAKENFAAGWEQIIGTSLKEFLEKM